MQFCPTTPAAYAHILAQDISHYSESNLLNHKAVLERMQSRSTRLAGAYKTRVNQQHLLNEYAQYANAIIPARMQEVDALIQTRRASLSPATHPHAFVNVGGQYFNVQPNQALNQASRPQPVFHTMPTQPVFHAMSTPHDAMHPESYYGPEHRALMAQSLQPSYNPSHTIDMTEPEAPPGDPFFHSMSFNGGPEHRWP